MRALNNLSRVNACDTNTRALTHVSRDNTWDAAGTRRERDLNSYYIKTLNCVLNLQ